jgi:hypothetical protein
MMGECFTKFLYPCFAYLSLRGISGQLNGAAKLSAKNDIISPLGAGGVCRQAGFLALLSILSCKAREFLNL